MFYLHPQKDKELKSIPVNMQLSNNEERSTYCMQGQRQVLRMPRPLPPWGREKDKQASIINVDAVRPNQSG